MKLIIAIVKDNDHEPVSRALTSSDFRATLIASTGGFLRRGSTTLLIGVDDERVEPALQIIRDQCTPDEAGIKGATIFVVKIDEYTHF